MLKGTLIYTTDEGIKHKYSLSGSDSMKALQLCISSNSYDALEYLESPKAKASPLVNVSPLELRRWDINQTTCKVELSQITLASDSVDTKADKETLSLLKSANAEFFARVSSLIRYIKSHCYTVNQEGYNGLVVASDEFFAETLQRYQVPLCAEEGIYAFIELELGYIHRMEFHWMGYDLVLKDEYDPYPQVLFEFKNKVVYGLSYSKDYIGFDGAPKYVPADDYTSGLMYKDLNSIDRKSTRLYSSH